MDKMADTKERSEYFHRTHPFTTYRTAITLPAGIANGISFHTYENDVEDTIARLLDMCRPKG